MRSREKGMFIGYLCADLLIINACISLTAVQFFGYSAWDFKQYGMYILHGNLSWAITYFFFVKKNFYLKNTFLNRLVRISKRMMIFLVVSFSIAFIIMPLGYSKMFIIEYVVMINFVKVLFYFILNQYSKRQFVLNRNIDNCLIVNYGKTGILLKSILDANPMLGHRIVGFLSDTHTGEKDVIGSTADLDEMIDKHQIQVVFVLVSFFGNSVELNEYLMVCNKKGVRVYYVPENQRWFASMKNAESIRGILLLNPQEIPLDDFPSRVQKRVFDLVFSLGVIIFIFTWLFPLIALLIKLTSRGPVFFVQNRTGINNRVFKCFKIRSMRVNASADIQQATSGDARITPMGRFMRRTNIDELPQFLNVLTNDMSVVGPRPHMLKHTSEYSRLIADYNTRHYVKPGITGWAQVNGFRGETDEVWKMEGRVEFDMEYIQNWSFYWDLKIIWLTIFGRNALKNVS